MKKVILSIVTIVMIFVMMPSVNAAKKPEITDHEKVTVYIFWGNGCPNCTSAIEYFYNLGDEYKDYIEVKTYEVWYNQDNNNFAGEVAELLDHELKGVPFLVVGEEYISGWGDNVGETLVNYALEYYQDSKYQDVVKKALKETDNDIEETSLEDAYKIEHSNENPDTTPEVPAGKYDGLIVVGIFVVLIGGFAALIIAGKK